MYASHQPNRAPTPPPQTIKIQVKQEPSSVASDTSEPCQVGTPAPGVKRSDPYEFDDDVTAANVSLKIFAKLKVVDVKYIHISCIIIFKGEGWVPKFKYKK